MISLGFSQAPLLEKTLYKGNNAFIGNETTMDSIFSKYKAYEFLLIAHDSLKIGYGLKLLEIEKLGLERDMYRASSENMDIMNGTMKLRFENLEKKNETEVQYYKEKAKGKFKIFLYGTVAGGLIVSILTLL